MRQGWWPSAFGITATDNLSRDWNTRIHVWKSYKNHHRSRDCGGSSPEDDANIPHLSVRGYRLAGGRGRERNHRLSKSVTFKLCQLLLAESSLVWRGPAARLHLLVMLVFTRYLDCDHPDTILQVFPRQQPDKSQLKMFSSLKEKCRIVFLYNLYTVRK